MASVRVTLHMDAKTWDTYLRLFMESYQTTLAKNSETGQFLQIKKVKRFGGK